jgi:alpha-tubulin suppressor-like RCC1 family protein
VRVHKLGLPVLVLGAVVALNLPAAASAGGAGPHAVGQANTVPGAVWAWGDGNGNGGGGSIVPLSARGLSDVVALAVVCPSPGGGVLNTGYALSKDGTVWAWGTGSDGELGNGTASTSSAPVQVHDLSGAVAVAAGSDTAYALRKDGTVWAWGASLASELGDGSNGPAQGYSDVPVQVQGLSGAVAVAGGGSDGYAVLKNGTVWAWGAGGEGQLGNGALVSESDVPVQVQGLSGAVAVAGGVSDGYAVLKNGTVWAWGADQDGQLGNGAQGPGSDVPVRVRGLSDVVAVAGDSWDGSVLALRKDGTVWHWGAVANLGSTASNDVPAVVHGLSHVVAITGGYFTEFALLSDGTVRGWGDDEDGEMGNGLNGYVAVPVQVSGLHGAVAIAGGVAEEFAVVVPKR